MHSKPLPAYPMWHLQSYLPSRSIQSAWWSHTWLFSETKINSRIVSDWKFHLNTRSHSHKLYSHHSFDTLFCKNNQSSRHYLEQFSFTILMSHNLCGSYNMTYIETFWKLSVTISVTKVTAIMSSKFTFVNIMTIWYFTAPHISFNRNQPMWIQRIVLVRLPDWYLGSYPSLHWHLNDEIALRHWIKIKLM